MYNHTDYNTNANILTLNLLIPILMSGRFLECCISAKAMQGQVYLNSPLI